MFPEPSSLKYFPNCRALRFNKDYIVSYLENKALSGEWTLLRRCGGRSYIEPQPSIYERRLHLTNKSAGDGCDRDLMAAAATVMAALRRRRSPLNYYNIVLIGLKWNDSEAGRDTCPCKTYIRCLWAKRSLDSCAYIYIYIYIFIYL